MTSAVQLPADVQEALNREKAYLDGRPRGGKGGRDWDFDKLEAPEAVSQSKVHHRVILPLKLPMVGLPWKNIPQHTVMAQGNTTSVTCPHRYSLLNDPNQTQGAPPPCALCEASDWLKEHARSFPKDSAENKEAWDRGVRLGCRERYYANDVDVDNIARHWKTNEQTGAVEIIPCVLPFGTEVADGFKAVMGEVGMFWHPQAFTLLKITSTKTGKADFNVERDVRMVLPAGGFSLEAVAPGITQHLLNNLNDIEGLVRLLPYDQLKSFVPAYARPNVAVVVPTSPHTPQALPPPMPAAAPIPNVGPPAVVAAPPVAAMPPMPALPPPVAAAPAVAAYPGVPAIPQPTMPAAPPVAAIPAIPQPTMPAAPAAASPTGMPPLPALPPMPGVPAVPTAAVPGLSPSSPPSSMPSMPPIPPMPKIG